jgi:ubiquinone/menaquinone biosynthesis C-methylase UbiE
VKYLNERSIDCIGVDINDHVVSRRSIANKVLKGDVLALPFKDGEFDCVICIDLLEHLTNRQIAKALSELKRVSSDKIIVGVTPKEREVFYADKTHVTALSFDEWEELLDSQLPERVASDFYDSRYVFSKASKAEQTPFSVELHRRIDNVVLPSFTQTTSSFSKEGFSFVDNTELFNATPQYIIVKKHNKTVACCPSFILEDKEFDINDGTFIFKKYRRMARKIKFRFDKSIVAYPPFVYAPEMLSRQDLSSIIRLICQKIDEICQKRSIDVSVLMCVHKNDRDILNTIEEYGYRELELHPNNTFTNGHNSFHKYLSLLPGIYNECVGNMHNSGHNFRNSLMEARRCDVKTDVNAALLKFHMWKARGIMNTYIGFLKRFYQAKTVLRGMV